MPWTPRSTGPTRRVPGRISEQHETNACPPIARRLLLQHKRHIIVGGADRGGATRGNLRRARRQLTSDVSQRAGTRHHPGPVYQGTLSEIAERATRAPGLPNRTDNPTAMLSAWPRHRFRQTGLTDNGTNEDAQARHQREAILEGRAAIFLCGRTASKNIHGYVARSAAGVPCNAWSPISDTKISCSGRALQHLRSHLNLRRRRTRRTGTSFSGIACWAACEFRALHRVSQTRRDRNALGLAGSQRRSGRPAPSGPSGAALWGCSRASTTREGGVADRWEEAGVNVRRPVQTLLN